MDIEKAYIEVEGYRRECGLRDIWSALKSIEMFWDDLDRYTKTAYNLVKRELEKEMTNGN